MIHVIHILRDSDGINGLPFGVLYNASRLYRTNSGERGGPVALEPRHSMLVLFGLPAGKNGR